MYTYYSINLILSAKYLSFSLDRRDHEIQYIYHSLMSQTCDNPSYLFAEISAWLADMILISNTRLLDSSFYILIHKDM